MSSISEALIKAFGKEQLNTALKKCKNSKEERLVILSCFKIFDCKNLVKMNSWQLGQVVRHLKKGLKGE